MKQAREKGIHIASPFGVFFYFSKDLNQIFKRLKEVLQQKLIECGWRDQVKSYCKGKRNKINFENLENSDNFKEIN